MPNKVSIDTKRLLIFIGIFSFLIIFLSSILTSSQEMTNQFEARGYINQIDQKDIYYVRQGPNQEFGLGYETPDNQIFQYSTLSSLIEDVLSQHAEATIFFEESVSQVSEAIIIDNSNNRLNESDIHLTMKGTLTSILPGGAFYGEGDNSNTYALQFLGLELSFDNLTFNSSTVSVKVADLFTLNIYNSSIYARPEYRNEFDGGAIINNGTVNIKESTVEWIDMSSNKPKLTDGITPNPPAKGYAIFSYGKIIVDQGVTENYSLIRGNGGISIQEGGELLMYNGSLQNTNSASEEGYKTLLVFNGKADIYGGELTATESS
ncbi:MAG: hypothetical protein PHG90_05940, partial [Clostridia bacterium]|nr:hypothetical protein [Clostridia bacterium]